MDCIGMAESRCQIAQWSAQAREKGAEYMIDTKGEFGQPDFPTFCMNRAELDKAKEELNGRIYGIWVMKEKKS
jgi:hypothetical protein